MVKIPYVRVYSLERLNDCLNIFIKYINNSFHNNLIQKNSKLALPLTRGKIMTIFEKKGNLYIS